MCWLKQWMFLWRETLLLCVFKQSPYINWFWSSINQSFGFCYLTLHASITTNYSFNSKLKFKSGIQWMPKSAFYHLKNICVHTFISSCLDLEDGRLFQNCTTLNPLKPALLCITYVWTHVNNHKMLISHIHAYFRI